jgi:Patatin-like phospholipase
MDRKQIEALRHQIKATRDQVYGDERDAIVRRREVQRELRDQKQLTVDDVEDTTIGLALSGGGVRSGAVSLGLMQALDERGALPYVDYLSTVSGGGYAGAYLSSVALTPPKNNGRDNGRADNRANVGGAGNNGRTSPNLMCRGRQTNVGKCAAPMTVAGLSEDGSGFAQVGILPSGPPRAKS